METQGWFVLSVKNISNPKLTFQISFHPLEIIEGIKEKFEKLNKSPGKSLKCWKNHFGWKCLQKRSYKKKKIEKEQKIGDKYSNEATISPKSWFRAINSMRIWKVLRLKEARGSYLKHYNQWNITILNILCKNDLLRDCNELIYVYGSINVKLKTARTSKKNG